MLHLRYPYDIRTELTIHLLLIAEFLAIIELAFPQVKDAKALQPEDTYSLECLIRNQLDFYFL